MSSEVITTDPLGFDSSFDTILLTGDCCRWLQDMPAESIHCAITSPPYFGLRDYGVEGQIGQESTLEEYLDRLSRVCSGVWRVLRPDGTFWLNLGDSYASSWPCPRRNVVGQGSLTNGKRSARPPRLPAGCKEKDLIGVPWRCALALQANGWYLRSDIVWSKPNGTPENVRDRPTRVHEYLFLLTKQPHYYYDAEAIKEPVVSVGRSSGNKRRKVADGTESRMNTHVGRAVPWTDDGTGRNRRSVWSIPTRRAYTAAHFAQFPPELVEPCLLAGCPSGGVVLDPFAGSGTVAAVARQHARRSVMIELKPDYTAMIEARLGDRFYSVSGLDNQ